MTAAVIAVLAAIVIGAGAAYQQEAAQDQDPHAVMDPRLVLRLLRSRRWLLGIGVSIAGFVLQAVAIATGRLVIVEPLLATQVVAALVVSARRRGLALGRRERLGVVATVAGVAGFLVVAAPTARAGPVSPAVPWSVPLLALLVVGAVGSLSATRMQLANRALTLALVAGLAFGCSDALIKLISNTADSLGAGVLGHWSPWAWLIVSPAAFLLQQSAYHSAHLAASLPGTSSLQPATGALLGAAMFGEQLRGGWALPVEAALAAVVLAGVITLARSPLIDSPTAAP